MTHLMFFGPSTTYGAWDSYGGYVQRVRKWLDEKVIFSNYKEYFIVYNLGIDGDTSKGILKRIEDEIKTRIWPGEETVIIISTGTNDSLFNNKTKLFKISEKDYEENIEKIFEIAKRYSEKVLFIGEHPIDEKKVDPVPWLKDFSYKTVYIKKFEEISKRVCRKNGIGFIDIYTELEKTNFKKMLVDGVHFNDHGHEIIFKAVKYFLVKNKIV